MKLIIAIVNKEDAKELTKKISENGFSATKAEGEGVFLNKPNVVFLIGTKGENVNQIVDIIKDCCKSKDEHVFPPTPQAIEPGELVIPETEKIKISGAIIFVVDVSDFFKL